MIALSWMSWGIVVACAALASVVGLAIYCAWQVERMCEAEDEIER